MRGEGVGVIILVALIAGAVGAFGVYYYQNFLGQGSQGSGGSESGGGGGSTQPPNYEATAVVRWVSDGDTIGIDITEVSDPHEGVEPGEDQVRFVGIDAEEMHQEDAVDRHPDVEGMTQSEYEETDYYKDALAAKNLVKSLASGGTKVYLDIDDLAGNSEPYRGYYGRLIAVVYVKRDGRWINVNAKVLKQGYAWVTQFKSEFHPGNWLATDYPYV